MLQDAVAAIESLNHVEICIVDSGKLRIKYQFIGNASSSGGSFAGSCTGRSAKEE